MGLSFRLLVQVNSRFGAGLMDGEAMIELVTDEDRETVPEKHICTNDVKDVNPNAVPQSVAFSFVSIRLLTLFISRK